MIAIVEVIKAMEGKHAELRKALHELVPLSRKGEGCLQYELFESTSASGDFLIFQKWKAPKDLARHENSSYIGEFVRKFDQVLYSEVSQYTEWKIVE